MGDAPLFHPLDLTFDRLAFFARISHFITIQPNFDSCEVSLELPMYLPMFSEPLQ